MQTIDAIKPAPKRPSDTNGALPPPRPRVVSVGSMDGISRAKGGYGARKSTPVTRARPAVNGALVPPVQSKAALATGFADRPVVPAKNNRSVKNQKNITQSGSRRAWLRIGLFVVGIVTLALLGVLPAVGQIAIVIYALLAIICKIESRMTFGFALATLVMIPVSQVLGAGYLAQSYAIFAFLLVFTGTLGFAVEIRRNKKVK